MACHRRPSPTRTDRWGQRSLPPLFASSLAQHPRLEKRTKNPRSLALTVDLEASAALLLGTLTAWRATVGVPNNLLQTVARRCRLLVVQAVQIWRSPAECRRLCLRSALQLHEPQRRAPLPAGINTSLLTPSPSSMHRQVQLHPPWRRRRVPYTGDRGRRCSRWIELALSPGFHARDTTHHRSSLLPSPELV